MKAVYKWLLGATLLLVVIAVAVLFYYNWRQNSQYADRITLTAHYMQYACGEDNLEMKVLATGSSRYNFLIDKDVALVTKDKKSNRIEEFVDKIVLDYQQGSEEHIKKFTITGRLHKYPHSFFDCSSSPWFTVEKIAYANGKTVSF